MAVKKWLVTSEKFLHADQVAALIQSLTDRRDLAIARGSDRQSIRAYYVVRALLETGLRVFEFCALNFGDLQGHRLSVRNGKGGNPRTVLLTRTTALLIKEWLAVRTKLGHRDDDVAAPLFVSRFGRRYSTRGLQACVKRALAVAGLPERFSAHSLRHTYCSLLLAAGKVSLATVRDNLGHHSIAVTNLYAHAAGNLDGIDLYQSPSAEKTELAALDGSAEKGKRSSSVRAFLCRA